METKLSPGFLVASPSIQDSFFAGAVILVLEHDDRDGTFGVVINKEATITFEEAMEQLGLPLSNFPASSIVLEGGPVVPEMGWVIHSADWTSSTSVALGESVAVSSQRDILEDIGRGEGPSHYLFCLGYAGWGPRQLVEELQRGYWVFVPFFDELLFGISIEARWKVALQHIGIDPMCLSADTGGA